MSRGILFVSFASYLDDANGASIASRAMMEALARRGFLVEVLCGPLLELDRELPPASDHRGLNVKGVPITILAGSTGPRTPDDAESRSFLQLFERAWARLRPDVVISYGGGPLTREVLHRARARGAATVFPLHNLRYRDPAPFADADAVLVASQFAAEHYRKTLGLRCTVLPNMIDRGRALAPERSPTAVVFVNPTVEKGVAVFARIADELGRRRPDIPFLVVEARGTEADVAACGLELRGHGTVFFHEHTPDPRRFWRHARLCLLPSLVPENQPLVAIEAMANGVPVLGSDRGGVPETLGAAGTVLPIPARLSPHSFDLPTPAEAARWVEAIERLWDSPAESDELGRKARLEAERWSPDLLEPRYEAFFRSVGGPGS